MKKPYILISFIFCFFSIIFANDADKYFADGMAIELDSKFIRAYGERGIARDALGDKNGANEDLRISKELGAMEQK